MSFIQRLDEIRTGFERPFWVANITEIFERLSYYGAFASLANYLHEKLNFPTEQTGTLAGIFGGMVWFLAIFGGAIADRLGFRRALSLAYLILATAYFLLGSIGAPWLAPVRAAVPPVIFVGFILILPALGISMVKPCVVGTTARASKENVRSIGYSIYYTMVNIGGASGPYVASWAHRHLGVENVFRVAALSVFLMFFAVLIFFREPKKVGDAPPPSISETLKNFLTVLGNPRFMLFLLIFTGYWIVFWQQYITLPGYIHGYISAGADVELILITDGLSVICLTVLINYLIRNRRNDSGAPLLRIHFPPRASGTARHLHGLRVSAHRHRLADRGMVRRAGHAPVWRSCAPASARLVGHLRRRRPDRSIALDLRSCSQTFRAGSSGVKRINLENRRRFFFLTKNSKLTTENFPQFTMRRREASAWRATE